MLRWGIPQNRDAALLAPASESWRERRQGVTLRSTTRHIRPDGGMECVSLDAASVSNTGRVTRTGVQKGLVADPIPVKMRSPKPEEGALRDCWKPDCCLRV